MLADYCILSYRIVKLTSEICLSGLYKSRLICISCRTLIPQTSVSCTHILNRFGNSNTSYRIYSSCLVISNIHCSTVLVRLKLLPGGDPGILNS